MNKFIALLIAVSASFSLFSQLDTSFWFVAPEVAQGHGDRPIVFRFATLNDPAIIVVSQPANPTFPIQTFNLAANSSQNLDLTTWIDMIENKPANSILNYGFKISASVPIMAYYEVTPSCNCNPDIFSLKGKNALGTSFFTPFQNFLSNASYARSAFNIVATEDNTTITILPTQNIVGHAANVPFTIILNKGQTYCAEASSTAANLHLSGSAIVSDKPISVTLSDDTAQGTPYGGCADLMGDQLIPISILGNEYIALKGYLNGPDKVYILGVTNGTQISIDGNVVTTINTAQTYVHTLSNPAVYIESSEPVYVLHQSGFGCEVGEAILPPIVCTGSNTVAFVRSTNEFFAINLLVPTGGETTFSLNGNPTSINPASFNFVPGTSNTWKYAQIDASALVAVQQGARIENSASKFHMGLIHGGASSGCRYGYFSDFASFRYEIQLDGDTYCVGETINLQTPSLPGATYEWSGPNGFSAVGESISIPNSQSIQSGQYVVSGNFPDACELIADSVMITVIDFPVTPQIYSNGPVCENDSLLFWNQVSSPLEFTWTDVSGNVLMNNDTITIYPAQSGQYSIQLTSNLGACVSPIASLVGQIYENPVVSYSGEIEVCGNMVDFSAAISADPQDPIAQTEWYTFPSLNVIGTGTIFQDVSASGTPSVSDNYLVRVVSANGCADSALFSVLFHPVPLVDFSWVDLCNGSTIDFENNSSWSGSPNPNDQLSYTWNYGLNTSSSNFEEQHSFGSFGTFPVELVAVSSNGCQDSLTQNVTVFAVPTVSFLIDDGCGSTFFDTNLGIGNLTIDSVHWFSNTLFSTNQPSFEQTFNSPGQFNGIYSIFASNNCVFDFPFVFEIIETISLENLVLPNVITANGDGVNDAFIVNPLFENCHTYQLDFVDRWGMNVFEMYNDSTPFIGNDKNGSSLTEGVYFYILTSDEGKKHGMVTLIK